MMHRACSGSQGHVMGPCTCGMFHSQNNSFSMLFSMPNHKPCDIIDDQIQTDMYSYTPSSSSSVDCTLSLGTPSTRFIEDEEKRTRHERHSVSNFCWDLLQSKHNPQSQTKSTRGTTNSGSNSTSDYLLARRCANCDTTSTPLWRNGPRGPKVRRNTIYIKYINFCLYFEINGVFLCK